MEFRRNKLEGIYCDGFVINYESVWREPLGESILQKEWDCLVLDESTRIMHRTSKQAKFILKINAKRKYILTGTPAPNGPLNLFNQLKFLDESLVGKSFYGFRDRYVTMGGYGGYQVIGHKNVEELQKKVNAISYRVKKIDCLDLPDKIYEVERITLNPEQRNAYDNLAKELITEVKKEKTISVTNALAKIVRLRQLTAGFLPIDKSDELYNFKNSAKFIWLKEFLTERFSNGKIIIWCIFRNEMDLIQRLLQELKLGFVRLDGSVPLNKRGELIKQFQENSEIKIFLGQQKAGGLGITLTAANVCIFMTNDFSSEIRLQAEDRCHRIGQTNKVLYLDLLARKTVDTTIYRMLESKKQFQNMITSDDFENIVKGDN